jgi:phage FluMu protein Com
MLADIRRIIEHVSERFKRRYYGSTFRCPVCHFVLAAVDADGHGLLICPVCGVVIEIESVYGHIVPVVNDIEIFRRQPKARLHPLATHLPIGLFPFALAGATLLLLASLLERGGLEVGGRLAHGAAIVADATLVVLAISVGFSILTFASGLWDWATRYRRRPYRQIMLKIVFATAFLVLGGVAVALHAAGLVFSGGSGLLELRTLAGVASGLVYFVSLYAGMVVLATLGHVGGTLVFGR